MAEPEEVLQELHVRCVRALGAYMTEANKTCKLLTAIAVFPVSLDARLEILEQRKVENEAHEEYQAARSSLFKAADWS